MQRGDEFIQIFPITFREKWKYLSNHLEEVEEIRLRAKKPIFVFWRGQEYFLTKDGHLSKDSKDAIVTSARELQDMIEHVCEYSIYAYEEELKRGFITVEGGHRIGVAGEIILENGHVKNMRHISYINIRIAHQIIGAANQVMKYLYQEGHLRNCLIISPPGGGKTTLLRDIIRQVSNGNEYGNGMNVGVIDERSEIAGSYRGVAQNDLGIRTDILDGCPKDEGMMMLIRSMAPGMIAIDELGGQKDLEALGQVIQCGCKVMATVHGYTLEEMKTKPLLGQLIEQGVFKRFIILSKQGKVGKIEGIYNEEFSLC